MGTDEEPGRRLSVEGEEAPAPHVPDAHDPSKKHAPTMLTTDLALRFDPAYEKISRRFLEHPDQFADAFARAWFKLTHRDMGPIARYLGPLVPKETLIWQDPIPAVDHPLIDEQDIAALKAKILASGSRFRSWSRPPGRRLRRSAAPTSAAERTARAFASRRRRTGRSTSRRSSRRCSQKLEAIQKEFNASANGGKKVSLADLIVLGGGAAIEKAAKDAGHDVKVPSRRAAWTRRRSRPTSSPSRRSSRGGRLPQLSPQASNSWRPRNRWSTRRSC